MHFLGNVNIFHSRLEEGVPGHLELATPATPNAQAVFVRPHDLSLKALREEPGSIEGRVSHIRTIGLSTRVSLTVAGGSQVQIELPSEEFQSLGLGKGDVAFATPKEMKVFNDDYSI